MPPLNNNEMISTGIRAVRGSEKNVDMVDVIIKKGIHESVA